MRRRRAAESGFSSLEILVCIVVLGIASLTLLSLISSSMTVNASSQYQVMAYKAAQDVMEQLIAMDYTQLPAQNGLTFDVISIKELTNKTIGSIGVVDVSGGSGKLYEITVRVAYVGDRTVPRLNINLVTRRAKS